MGKSLLPLENLQIGINELLFLQLAIKENSRDLFSSLIKQYGVLLYRDSDGELSSGLQPFTSGGIFSVRSGFAFNENHQLMERTSYSSPTVPADSNWYKIILRPSETADEAGSINLVAGSKTVTGIGTDFTRHKSKADTGVRGDNIYINTGGSNDGAWEIDSITDETTLTLVNNAVANETAAYSISGNFLATGPSDPTIHRRVSATVVISSGALSDGDILLGMVMYDGANYEIQDLRSHNRLRLHTVNTGNIMIKNHYSPMDTGMTRFVVDAGDNPTIVESEDELICAYENSAGSAIECKTIDDGGSTASWAAAGAVSVITGGTFPQLAVLPNGDILCSYLKTYTNVGCAVKKSTDRGATWGGELKIHEPGGANNVLSQTTFFSPSRGWLIHTFFVDDGNLYSYYSDDFGTSWNSGWTLSTIISSVKSLRMCEMTDGTLILMGIKEDTDPDSIIFIKYPSSPGAISAVYPKTPLPDFDILGTAGQNPRGISIQVIKDAIVCLFVEHSNNIYAVYSNDEGDTWNHHHILMQDSGPTYINTFLSEKTGLLQVVTDTTPAGNAIQFWFYPVETYADRF